MKDCKDPNDARNESSLQSWCPLGLSGLDQRHPPRPGEDPPNLEEDYFAEVDRAELGA